MAKLMLQVKLPAELETGAVPGTGVARIERDDFAVPETLGLTLAEGRQLAAAVQAGARQAVVEDPDGIAVGLMSRIDPARRTGPPGAWQRCPVGGLHRAAQEVPGRRPRDVVSCEGSPAAEARTGVDHVMVNLLKHLCETPMIYETHGVRQSRGSRRAGAGRLRGGRMVSCITPISSSTPGVVEETRACKAIRK